MLVGIVFQVIHQLSQGAKSTASGAVIPLSQAPAQLLQEHGPFRAHGMVS